MRAVWEAGSTGTHEQPQRKSLHELMVSKPMDFLRQMRDMEESHRAELKQYRKERDERLAGEAAAEKERQAKEQAAVLEATLPVTNEEEKAETLMAKLLGEWKESKVA